MPPASGGRSRPHIPWPRRRGPSRSSGEATPWTRRWPPPSRSPSATPTTAAWAVTCSRWCSARMAPRSPSTRAAGRRRRSIPTRSARDTAPPLPEQGPDPITVPGAVSGWATLHAEGATLPWPEAFGPAIALAFGGVTVSRSLSRALAEREPLLATDPGMADVFFEDGAPLPHGALFRQAGARCDAAGAGGRRAGRALRRRDRRALRRRAPGGGFTDHRGRPRRALGGRRPAAQRALSRCRRAGGPAEQPGVHAAGDPRARRTAGHRPRSARPGRGPARADLRGREP